ncbi:MAG: activator of Hsp90 ATPase 1 family protein [Streptosporangiaceae bacterium]|nr:activator of Hsp90 ATPase 1 family protein [Streptosporangiaceae bacterium]
MTRATDPAAGTVLPLRRPPVRQATVVGSDQAHTFDVFVATIGAWWPLQPFSAGGKRVREVIFEQRLGGRVYETWDDGSTVDWGTVLAWEPPRRFAMTWLVTGTATEVELTFTALGPALTRVAVEHRGWDALTDAELSADCALPGGYTGGAFTRGWATILSRFQAAIASTQPPADPSQKREYL